MKNRPHKYTGCTCRFIEFFQGQCTDSYELKVQEKNTYSKQALSERTIHLSKKSFYLEVIADTFWSQTFLPFLGSNVCAVTELTLANCGLNDECIQCVCRLDLLVHSTKVCLVIWSPMLVLLV